MHRHFSGIPPQRRRQAPHSGRHRRGAMESGEAICIDCGNDESIPKEIRITDNLMIIGTVNVDETTYTFSPKVLDRSNVIEFGSVPASSYLSGNGPNGAPAGNVDYLQDCMNGASIRRMKGPDIIKAIRSSGSGQIADVISNDLEKLQGCMESMGLPIGLRTIDEVMRFMYAAWNYTGHGDFQSYRRFFDSQIRQKILPKVHGGQEIADGLKSMLAICNDGGYDRSASRIERMVKTLEKQRYASFN